MTAPTRFRPRASGPTEVWVDGEIGYDTTARQVADQLRAASGGPVVVNINSGGGDAFDGLAAYEALRQHPGHVEVRIAGLAASAASVVAMGADELVMAPSATLMIHDAACMTWGTQADHVASAALLGQVSDTIASVYAARAGGTAAQWREVMRGEHWYTASEAVDAGLADRVGGSQAVPVVPFARARRDVSAGQLAAHLREGFRAAVPERPFCGVVAARVGGPARRPVGRRAAPSALPILRLLKAARQ